MSSNDRSAGSLDVRAPAKATPPPTLRHRIEYLAFRTVSGILSAAPEGLADRTGAALGWLTARVAPVRWSLVMSQLERAFPERDLSWRKEIARRSYAHLGAEAIAMVRMSARGADQVVARTSVHGIDVVEEAVARGQGVVAVTGHLGNWELGGAALAARGLPVDVVVARQRNRLFDARLEASREALGMTVIPRGQAPRRVLGSLRAGRVVGILGDQDARKAGIFVDFFGRPASTARGPAVLSLRSGARLVLGVAIREGGAEPRYAVYFEALDPPGTGDLDQDVRSLTQSYTRRLEEYIRRFPEQYFWLHRRWKTAPPGTGDRNGSEAWGV
ncbi:MAG: lysophospholipid acyltransferase family protein [Gemmatimonadetes bacterium]|nr:lysophospholipid acyltransferase family protein [Gemmatimonadota bacterium]